MRIILSFISVEKKGKTWKKIDPRSVINYLKYKFSFKKEIKSLELNKGLISEDRNNKATQPLTIPRSYLSRLQRICSFPHFCNYNSRFIE